MSIYSYDSVTGCLLGMVATDPNPLDPASPLLPTFATPAPAPAVGVRECARYLDAAGDVPAYHADGSWIVQPDWRDVDLWSIEDGSTVMITEPNVTPAERGATAVQYPGPGYVWHDGQWQEDPELQYQLAEQAADQELSQRQAEATAEINRIQPAVDGGYAKPSDIELLPQWQRYLYELPDTRERPGWPEEPQWSDKPGAVV